jgi:hypothetical protein
MTKDEALTLALEVLEDWGSPLALPSIIAIKEALAQPDYRAVKTYHEGKPVYVSQTEFPLECKTVAEQTAYAFGWWKALESVRAEPDWKDLYEKQKRRAEMWIAKYEKDIRPLEKAVPVAQEPRNFCPRCGKRTADLTAIHTCTPPEGGHQ